MAFDKLEDLLAVAKNLTTSTEGFVVQFSGGLRLKVKGDEYVRVHRLVSNVTPLAIHEMLICGDDLSAVRQQLPEEFHIDFDTITGLLRFKFNESLLLIGQAYAGTRHFTDKELGLWLSRQTLYSVDIAKWIFAARKKQLFTAVHLPNSVLRRRLYNSIRPDNNRLQGYQPTSAVNRFTQETA